MVSALYRIVVKALLAKGPACESSMAWFAGSRMLYSPVRAALLKVWLPVVAIQVVSALRTNCRVGLVVGVRAAGAKWGRPTHALELFGGPSVLPVCSVGLGQDWPACVAWRQLLLEHGGA